MGTLQNNLNLKETLHNKVINFIMTTIHELLKLAKETKVNKDQLCLVLGMEPIPPNEKYECFCRGKTNKTVKITLVNKKTGEKQEYKSLYKAARTIGKNPDSISYQLKNNGEIEIGENILRT